MLVRRAELRKSIKMCSQICRLALTRTEGKVGDPKVRLVIDDSRLK